MEAGFYLLTALAGLLGGILFPLADALYRHARPGANIGAVYGLDLTGAAIGALITASLAIPVLGMYPALAWLAGLNLLSGGATAMRR